MVMRYLLMQDRFVVAWVTIDLTAIVENVQPNQEELVEAVEVVKVKQALELLQALLVSLFL